MNWQISLKIKGRRNFSILWGWNDDIVGAWAGLIALQLLVGVEAEISGDSEGPVFSRKKYVAEWNIIQDKEIIIFIKEILVMLCSNLVGY